jgi:hypothetical protein
VKEALNPGILDGALLDDSDLMDELERVKFAHQIRQYSVVVRSGYYNHKDENRRAVFQPDSSR